MPASEIIGNFAAQSIKDLSLKLEASQRIISDLLKHVGSKGRCKWCGADIVWIRHNDTSKNAPYDLSGINHWATCSKAKEHRNVKPASTERD